MDSQIKAEWVASLRSGKYKQGRDVLRWGDAFCCLGVLCDLHSKEGLGRWSEDEGGRTFYLLIQDGRPVEHTSVLPSGVMRWAGIHPSLGNTIRVDGYGATLANLNDSQRPFDEIADVIERRL